MIADFCRDWLFFKDGNEPVRVDLPHDAMITEERKADCANGVNTGYFPGGLYHYQKTFFLNEKEAEMSVTLHFEGVYQKCTVEINGIHAGSHLYGFSAFEIDLCGKVHSGENILTVHADNTEEPNCRWYSGSGIYRPVSLIIRPLKHIQKLHISTVSYDPAVIKAETDGEEIEIYEDDHCIYKGLPGEIRIENARLWDSEHPYLYRCIGRLGEDTQETMFGIRKIEWKAQNGFLVNGNRVLLRGGCIHHDHGILGACEYEESEERRIRILKENGFNAIRMAHHPASRITLDVCDRLGMYVMNETFDGWYIPKTRHDYAASFKQDHMNVLREMAESSFNHPSVILYSIGNEITESIEPSGLLFAEEMTDWLHRYDPYRPVTAGINVLLNVYTKLGMGVYKEDQKETETKAYKEKKTSSAFFNMMADKLGKLMFVMSAGKKGDEACRAIAKRLDLLGLNYASSRYDEDVRKYPERMMIGSETMAGDLAYNWERVKKYPQLTGDFVWSAWDYLGEACIGDWTYYSYSGLPLLAGQGMIDITGKPLAAMAYLQTVWGMRTEPFIAVSPLNHAGERPKKGAWQFTNGIDSWNWHGFEGKKAHIDIFGNGTYAKLILNGRTVGTKKLKGCRTSFDLKYESGTLTAVILDGERHKLSSSTLSTGTCKAILSVQAEKKQAKREEIIYVPVEFRGEDGQLIPYLEKSVSLQIGNGRLIGFGSALCKTDETFREDHHRTYRGRSLAVIRTKEKGILKIKASCEGFEDAYEEIEVSE